MIQANKCHGCGASSYKPVIKRDDSGAMRPSGEFQCVGCKWVFTDIDKWRFAPSGDSPEVQPELPEAPSL